MNAVDIHGVPTAERTCSYNNKRRLDNSRQAEDNDARAYYRCSCLQRINLRGCMMVFEVFSSDKATGKRCCGVNAYNSISSTGDIGG
jgi:hypothetical protein